jgi:hypothetical protein
MSILPFLNSFLTTVVNVLIVRQKPSTILFRQGFPPVAATSEKQ